MRACWCEPVDWQACRTQRASFRLNRPARASKTALRSSDELRSALFAWVLTRSGLNVPLLQFERR